MTEDRPRDSSQMHAPRFRIPRRLRGLRVQIILWTVIPLTLVLIGVGFTGAFSHEQAMRDLVSARDQALATVSAGQVQDMLEERSDALTSLAAEPAFHHQDYEAVQVLLDEAGDFEGLFADGAALVDESGSVLVTGQALTEWPPDEQLADLVRAIMVRQDVSLIPLSDSRWGENAYLMGIPVPDETNTTYGILVAPVSLSNAELETLLSQAQVGEHSAAYLVDGSGQILASAPAERARDSLVGHTGLGAALQGGGAGATLCHAPDGERMTMAYAPVDFGGLGWRVLVEEPWQEVIGPVLRYSQFMPLVAALAAIVSLLTLYYGVRAIVRPLQALGQEAERVAWGDFEATSTPVGGVEEIEDLRRTLDQMAGRIQSYQSGMHDYIAAITQGQEEERKRLARELHDDTAQALIALGQRAQKLLSTDAERAAERLSKVRAMLAETVEGVRRFSRDLRPIYLDDLGFIPALEMLTREADQRENLSVRLAIAGPVRRLPPDLELTAFRIVQEALNNAIQHAQASQVEIVTRFEEPHLVLSVRDDGQGFEPPNLPDALARQGHFGLMGIQERTLLYGGQLTISSAPGEGTEIVVRLPFSASG
jgi:signal transduction histidine kinase